MARVEIRFVTPEPLVYHAIVWVDEKGMACIRFSGEGVVFCCEDHTETFKLLDNLNGVAVIRSGKYTLTSEVKLNNVVLQANPLVEIDGKVVVGSNVHILGYPKIREVDTTQAKNYYLEVDTPT